jgi:hypothetical protein
MIYPGDDKEDGVVAVESRHPEMDRALQERVDVVEQYNAYLSTFNSEVTTSPNANHWSLLTDMAMSYLLPDALILHVGASPLVGLLSGEVWRRQIWVLTEGEKEEESAPEFVLNSGAHVVKWADDELSVQTFDLMVVNLQTTKTELKFDHMLSTEFILVIGECSAAPTDFDVLFSDASSSSTGSTSLVHYSAIEDVCRVGATDVGGVMFRYYLLLLSLFICRLFINHL